MEVSSSSNNTHTLISSTNMHSLFDLSSSKFRNEDYILKFSNQANLKFFKDEVTIKYSGKGYNLIDYASVQSNKTINKNDPVFYYEVEIVDEGSKKDITIGFSDKEFVLNKQCGTTSKSFGYNGDGKIYHDKPKGDSFGPKFKQKDVIGCGYYFSKNSIFYTINGKFIGWAFKNVEYMNYYATISLHSLNEKVTVNFGKTNFFFDIEGFYISQTQEKLNAIIAEKIEINDLDYIVREYLVHSGYQETFNAMEIERMIGDVENFHPNGVDSNNMDIDIQQDVGSLSWKKAGSLGIGEDSKEKPTEDQQNDIENIRKYSTDEVMIKEPEVRKRTLSIMMDRMNDESADAKNPDVFLIMNFLKERKVIQNMIAERDYDTALTFFTTHFQQYSVKKEINFKKIVMCLSTLKYLERLKGNDYISAYEVLNKLDSSFWNKDVTISLYDSEDKICDFTFEGLSVLLCYVNISNCELSHFFTDKQIALISNQINSLILELPGLSSESVLEKILKQQAMVSYLYGTIKNCPGEKINVKI